MLVASMEECARTTYSLLQVQVLSDQFQIDLGVSPADLKLSLRIAPGDLGYALCLVISAQCSTSFVLVASRIGHGSQSTNPGCRSEGRCGEDAASARPNAFARPVVVSSGLVSMSPK